MGRSTSKGRGAASIALLVASCLLLLATVGETFVSSPSLQVSPSSTWEVKAAQPVNRHGGLGTPNTQASLFKAAASVALLCVAATKCVSKNKTPKSSVRCVVGMTAPSTVTSTTSAPPKSIQMEDLLKFEDQPAENVIPEVPVAPASTPVIFAKTVTCAVPVESEAPAVAAFCGALRAARFAAGARRNGSRHARTSSGRAGRAARRAVGQRLCEAFAVHQPMPFESFDASKTRGKIQLGLRVSSCMRSESGRESKVSSGVDGSEMGTCLNFVAHDLKVYMLDHESALNDAIHSRFGNLAQSAKL